MSKDKKMPSMEGEMSDEMFVNAKAGHAGLSELLGKKNADALVDKTAIVRPVGRPPFGNPK